MGVTLHLAVALAILIAVFPSCPTRAWGEVITDPLGGQSFPFHTDDHRNLVKAVSEARMHSVSLNRWAESIVLFRLEPLESTCRTGLWSKEMEPGSPWLRWRSFGRIDLDGCAWYIGALSCIDSLCGPQLVSHERLALLCVGRERSEVTLFPREPSTIRDEEQTVVDSVAILRGEGYALVQARREISSEHPCYDGPESHDSTQVLFALLRGDSLIQAFALLQSASSSSHDDVDGDSGTDHLGNLRVTADAVHLDYRIEEWVESPGIDATELQRKVAEIGFVRFEYRPKTGRFVRAQ